MREEDRSVLSWTLESSTEISHFTTRPPLGFKFIVLSEGFTCVPFGVVRIFIANRIVKKSAFECATVCALRPPM